MRLLSHRRLLQLQPPPPVGGGGKGLAPPSPPAESHDPPQDVGDVPSTAAVVFVARLLLQEAKTHKLSVFVCLHGGLRTLRAADVPVPVCRVGGRCAGTFLPRTGMCCRIYGNRFPSCFEKGELFTESFPFIPGSSAKERFFMGSDRAAYLFSHAGSDGVSRRLPPPFFHCWNNSACVLKALNVRRKIEKKNLAAHIQFVPLSGVCPLSYTHARSRLSIRRWRF